MIIQKIGWTYVFVFPTEIGRIKASENPAGILTIGKNISVAYALRIIRSGNARFIGFYGESIPEPKLRVVKAGETFGFVVKSVAQPNLQIYIEPSFMAEKKKELQQKIAQEGNLNVTLERQKDGTFKVLRVVLD